MTPQEYCATKTNRPASSIYYALFTTTVEQRPHLIALLALHKEINEVLSECKEASVARIKLAWWHAEIERALAGQASHPISHALSAEGALLAPSGSDHSSLQQRHQLLSAMIKATEMDLDQGRYLDWPNLEQYLQLNAVALAKLLTWQLLGKDYQAAKHEQPVTLIAKGIGLSMIIRDVGLHNIQGRIYIPMSDLRRFNVTAHQIQQRQPGDNFNALIAFEIQRARDFFEAANRELKQLPKADVRRLRPLITLATMHKQLLQKIAKEPSLIFNHRLSLSPLRKAWIAQKHHFSANTI